MKFASTLQIVILSVLTCAGLFALDYVKNPQLWHRASVVQAGGKQEAQLRLRINHLCCTACLDDVRRALAGLQGLQVAPQTAAKSLPTQAQADQLKTSLPEYGNTIDLSVKDFDKVDLIAIDEKLRANGLVAGQMELSGVEHFALRAEVEHLCCGLCERSIHERLAFLKARGQGGQFKWLDSVVVDAKDKAIIAYARYLEPGKTVDIADFISGLNEIGFAPHTLHVTVGEHKLFPTGSQ